VLGIQAVVEKAAGFSRMITSQEKWKPFETVSRLLASPFTWLKPGVNEIREIET